VMAREAWIREFREQVALFMACMQTLGRHAREHYRPGDLV